MKLSYRGVPYEPEAPNLEIEEGEIGGKYRGQAWKYHYPRHIPQLQPKLYRQYRGVAYSTRPIVQSEENYVKPGELTQPICSVQIYKPRKIAIDELSKTHLDNIRRNLERRLEVAQTRGDSSLIDLLKQECQQLALNI